MAAFAGNGFMGRDFIRAGVEIVPLDLAVF
jgi:hypothetical protein